GLQGERDSVAGMKADSDAGNLSTKCALCVHSLSGGRGQAHASEQSRCPWPRFASCLSNALIWQWVSRDVHDAKPAAAYCFVVQGPQTFFEKSWRFYHSDQPATDRIARVCSAANRSARNRPVAEPSRRATSSGVPSATMRP